VETRAREKKRGVKFWVLEELETALFHALCWSLTVRGKKQKIQTTTTTYNNNNRHHISSLI